MQLRLSEKADNNLTDIYRYGYVTYGEKKADFYYDKILASFDVIVRNPYIATLRYDISPPIRALPVQSHIVLYDIIDDSFIDIIAVPHASSDWQKTN